MELSYADLVNTLGQTANDYRTYLDQCRSLVAKILTLLTTEYGFPQGHIYCYALLPQATPDTPASPEEALVLNTDGYVHFGLAALLQSPDQTMLTRFPFACTIKMIEEDFAVKITEMEIEHSIPKLLLADDAAYTALLEKFMARINAALQGALQNFIQTKSPFDIRQYIVTPKVAATSEVSPPEPA